MSIRVRLLLSYMAMLVIPLVLSFFAAAWLAGTYAGDLGHAYNLDFRRGSVEEVVRGAAAAFEEIKLTVASNPDRLLDNNYLGSLERRINISNTGIIVRKNGRNVYISKMLRTTEIPGKIPEAGYNGDHELMPLGSNLLAVNHLDFIFGDGSPGSVYLATDVSPVGVFARRFFHSLFLAILVILVLTNGLLTFIVSRSIIKPIETLKAAAGQIRDGNLNAAVTLQGKDEIGQLGLAFEEMRCKLKESIDLQLQYEENRKELLSSISHDLKTPITAITGYIEGIQDGVADSPAKLNKYLETIHIKADDMDKLIDELFLFSKLDLNKEPFFFEKVDLVSYLRHSTEDLQVDLGDKGIFLEFCIAAAEPLLVVADREKLKRVITNIIDNAMKYLDKESSRIVMKLTADGETATVAIADNGQGIPPDKLPLIFNRFYRADPSRNTATGGSGLGLAIARRIIEEHGGRIWAESEPGVGTSIFFTLKRAVG